MYTRCPACQSAFRVTAATLRAAHGQVVCDTCHTTFDALFGLMDELPAPAAIPVPAALPEAAAAEPPAPAAVAAALADAGALLEELDDPAALEEVTLLHIPGGRDDWNAAAAPQVAMTMAAERAQHEAPAAPEAPTAPEASAAPVDTRPAESTRVELDDDDPTGTWAPLPSSVVAEFAAAPEAPAAETESAAAPAPEADPPPAAMDPVLEEWLDEPAPARRLGWAWTLGSVALIALLGLQAVHHWREALARHPTLGPALTALYSTIGQPLPPESELLAFQVTTGTVGTAPAAGVLRVSAQILNRSPRALELPLLQVTLEDRYGAPIGRRTFGPGEYAPARLRHDIDARGTVDAVLDLADPGKDAVGFKLDLCLGAANGLTCASDLAAEGP